MYRSRREKKRYERQLRQRPSAGCVFCEIGPGSEQLVEQGPHFKVIRNIYGYSQFDYGTVTDHLMVVPNQHTDTLSSLGDEEKIEFVNLIQRYEDQGYNILARPAGSAIKTVSHQHTHCIKTGGRRKRFLLYLKKPYLRWVR